MRCFILFISLGPLASHAKETQPNIILILCDDLGYGDVAGFGFKDLVTHTPHIDQLGK